MCSPGQRAIDSLIAAALGRHQGTYPWAINIDLGDVDRLDTAGPGFPDAVTVKRGGVIVTYERKES